jgi:hypothetical protein
VLAEEGVERIAGAHCYEFYAGSETFAAMADAEPGTFFLTDYLVRHFDRLVVEGLGLDRTGTVRRLFRHYRASSIWRRRGRPLTGRRAAGSSCRSKCARPASASCKAKS